MLEIHELLPFLKEYIYLGHTYTQNQLEEIKESKILDLRYTGWDSLEYAKGIVSPKYVEKINLYGLPLKDINTLKEYVNLKWLDMRVSSKSTICMEDILNAIRGRFLQWICINTSNGKICEKLNDMIKEKEVCIEKIYASTPNYSEAHKRIYSLKQAEQKTQFYISKRSDISKAKKEYEKNNEKKDLDLLRAVFELEIDDEGILGLNGKDTEATLWNGLSLAEYYIFQDYTDENRNAYEICHVLEPYIHMDESELSFYFGKVFGKVLKQSNEYNKAKQWILNSWRSKRIHFRDIDVDEIKNMIIWLGLDLYDEYIRCKDEKTDEFGEELLEIIKTIKSYYNSSEYLQYLFLSLANIFSNWEKGQEIPEELENKMNFFCKCTKEYAEEKNSYEYFFYALYLNTIYANRIENTKEAAKLLSKIKVVNQKMGFKEDDRKNQANRIMYWEQKIYYLFLIEDKNEIIETIDELIDYPYRAYDKDLDSYCYVRAASLQNVKENIDKHRLWSRIWY